VPISELFILVSEWVRRGERCPFAALDSPVGGAWDWRSGRFWLLQAQTRTLSPLHAALPLCHCGEWRGECWGIFFRSASFNLDSDSFLLCFCSCRNSWVTDHLRATCHDGGQVLGSSSAIRSSVSKAPIAPPSVASLPALPSPQRRTPLRSASQSAISARLAEIALSDQCCGG
jgi:hypothetical protein